MAAGMIAQFERPRSTLANQKKPAAVPKLPSAYFRLHGFASFQEDKPGLDLAERYQLVDNLMWGNDYPHHEGTWPHSAEAIERTMGGLSDGARAKVLGLNAARFFGFRMP